MEFLIFPIPARPVAFLLCMVVVLLKKFHIARPPIKTLLEIVLMSFCLMTPLPSSWLADFLQLRTVAMVMTSWELYLFDETFVVRVLVGFVAVYLVLVGLVTSDSYFNDDGGSSQSYCYIWLPQSFISAESWFLFYAELCFPGFFGYIFSHCVMSFYSHWMSSSTVLEYVVEGFHILATCPACSVFHSSSCRS